MTEPRPEEIVNIEGPPNESVFRRLLTWLTPFHEMEKFQRELDEYWAHYRDLTDDRALVVVGALCVEDCVDRMINAFFLSSKTIHDNRDFTFSLKIDVVEACRFIPARVLRHCDLVRKLRNDFAHNLELKTLSDLDPGRLQSVDQAISSYVQAYDLSVPYAERFKALVGFICVALKMYTSHVESMRAFVDSVGFQNALKKFKQGKD